MWTSSRIRREAPTDSVVVGGNNMQAIINSIFTLIIGLILSLNGLTFLKASYWIIMICVVVIIINSMR